MYDGRHYRRLFIWTARWFDIVDTEGGIVYTRVLVETGARECDVKIAPVDLFGLRSDCASGSVVMVQTASVAKSPIGDGGCRRNDSSTDAD